MNFFYSESFGRFVAVQSTERLLTPTRHFALHLKYWELSEFYDKSTQLHDFEASVHFESAKELNACFFTEKEMKEFIENNPERFI